MKRVALTLVVTGLCTAYILWKIDLGKTGHVLASAHVGWWLLSLGILLASVVPMPWRWQRLLEALAMPGVAIILREGVWRR